MDMCYDGALVMPSSYAVMDEEEMTYVEGGYYVSNATICGFIMTCFAAYCTNALIATAAVSALTKAVTRIWSNFLGWVCSLFGGVVGTVVGKIIGYYTGYTFASKFALAAITGKGVDITINGLSVK